MNLVATTEGLGLLDDDVIRMLALPYPRLDSLLHEPTWRQIIASAEVRDELQATDADLVSVVSRCASVWITGTNYKSKARAMKRATPASPFFAGKGSSSITNPDAQVALPLESASTDFEGEVGVVISREAYRISERDAWDHVAGIVAANDISARDLMNDGDGVAISKSFPGFCPLGSNIVTPETLTDRDDIGLEVSLNSVRRQSARTNELIFPIAELIARLSSTCRLLPGDVILTGSPAGSGQEDGRFLEPGDTVIVSIEGLLPLSTNFVAMDRH